MPDDSLSKTCYFLGSTSQFSYVYNTRQYCGTTLVGHFKQQNPQQEAYDGENLALNRHKSVITPELKQEGRASYLIQPQLETRVTHIFCRIYTSTRECHSTDLGITNKC